MASLGPGRNNPPKGNDFAFSNLLSPPPPTIYDNREPTSAYPLSLAAPKGRSRSMLGGPKEAKMAKMRPVACVSHGCAETGHCACATGIAGLCRPRRRPADLPGDALSLG